MEILDFCDGWKCGHLGDAGKRDVSVPHDAMIGEERRKGAPGGVNTGWVVGYDYEYVKTFTLPEEYGDRLLTLEFEGVYRGAEVYVNGALAASRPYGYTNFYVPLNGLVRFGAENEIRVIARCADQPDSRWYTGAGIYRPVNLYVQERRHILINGIRIATESINPAVVSVKVKVSDPGAVKATIYDGGTVLSEKAADAGEEAVFRFEIEDASLWSPDNPHMYTLTAEYAGEKREEAFGVRTVEVSHDRGFELNGERVIIRGACVHHDNGILGARCLREAESRKIELMKKAGYNAVRCAHNPCSKYMLEACDRLGMMVMDEYADMWYEHKTRFDYASHVTDWYERDLSDMVDKDYNHPCVIMYSMGNEVTETAEKRGIELFRSMKACVKGMDATRPVTVAVNIFFNWLHSMGFGVYSEKKAVKHPDAGVGSTFFNNLSGLMGACFMKFMATRHPCDVLTRGCFAEADVAGYNYGILRYGHDSKKYRDRVILGSETFCSDAYRFWETAKKNPAVIGDFVWAGMDYLGETGVGAWEYSDYAPEFRHGVGWRTAGSGRVDLIGTELGEALYTKVAFELDDGPEIAVVPVNHTRDRHSPSAWKFTNALPSWSWNGCDGKRARVEVYSRAPCVGLFVNGRRVGRKKFRKDCRFVFNTRYRDGEITAVAYDGDGKELSRKSLKTAGDETHLSVLPEKATCEAGENCFVRLRFTDGEGTLKPLERNSVSVRVTGGELIALGSACPYYPGEYTASETDTYYGEAMAVIRADGDVRIEATSGNLTASAEIKAVG